MVVFHLAASVTGSYCYLQHHCHFLRREGKMSAVKMTSTEAYLLQFGVSVLTEIFPMFTKYKWLCRSAKSIWFASLRRSHRRHFGSVGFILGITVHARKSEADRVRVSSSRLEEKM